MLLRTTRLRDPMPPPRSTFALTSTPEHVCAVGRGSVIVVRGHTTGPWAGARFRIELGACVQTRPHPRELRLDLLTRALETAAAPPDDDLFGGFFLPIEVGPELAGTAQRLRITLLSDGAAQLVFERTIRFVDRAPLPEEEDDAADFGARAESARLQASRAPIAVCLATYDPDPALLTRQLDTLIAQTRGDWICIVQDDHSPPARFAQIRDLCARDPRFFVFRSPNNQGFYRNFERCLRRVPASAEYVALCDQDDAWYPDKLAAGCAALTPGVTLAYSDMRLTDARGRVLAASFFTARRNHYRDLDALLVCNTVTGAASVFRASLLPVLLPFPPALPGSFHDHFIACAALCCGRIAYVDRPLYDYTQHGGNVLGQGQAGTGSLRTTARELAYLVRIAPAPAQLLPRLLDIFRRHEEDYRRLSLYRAVLTRRIPNLPAAARRALALFSDRLRDGLVLMLGTHACVLLRQQSTSMAEFWLGFGVLARRAARPLLPRLLSALPPAPGP